MGTLDEIVLFDSAENEVRLGDLWADSAVALVFLRHYG